MMLSMLLAVVAEEPMADAALANNRFAIAAYQQLTEDGENLVFSPLSIRLAVAMAHAGARGETAGQIAAAVHLSAGYDDLRKLLDGLPERRGLADRIAGMIGRDRPAAEFTIANRVWLDDQLAVKDAFVAKMQQVFDARPGRAPFRSDPDAVRDEVNRWVSGVTRNKIENLLGPGSVTTRDRMLLVNAVYMKARWLKHFYESSTRAEPFRRDDGGVKDVPLMYVKDDFSFAEVDGVKAVWLPYEGTSLAFLAVLPAEGATLAMLDGSLTAERLMAFDDAAVRRPVKVYLPKFEVRTGVGLKSTLAKLGMPLAFSGAADFRDVSESEALQIGAVVHEAVIEVAEQGTEAAAATAVKMATTAAAGRPQEPVVFRADRPFVYAVVESNTGALVFLGRYAGP